MRVFESALLSLLAVPLACNSGPAADQASMAMSSLRSSSDRGSGDEQVQVRDDCDPATFDAALGPGACVGKGNTTLQEFFEELTETQTAKKWRFTNDQFGIDPGETIVATNRGGEAHTFTQVAEFGGGFVPQLNDLSGNPDVAPECQLPGAAATIVPPGGSRTVNAPASGTVKYQCCIHPWMRAVATVKQ